MERLRGAMFRAISRSDGAHHNPTSDVRAFVFCRIRRIRRRLPFTTYRRGSSTRPPYTPRRWGCWRRVLKPPSCPGRWTSIASARRTWKRGMGRGNVICARQRDEFRGEGWFSHAPFALFTESGSGSYPAPEPSINRTTDGQARRKQQRGLLLILTPTFKLRYILRQNID